MTHLIKGCNKLLSYTLYQEMTVNYRLNNPCALINLTDTNYYTILC